MVIAAEMKGLCDDIIASYDTRVKALGNLTTDVHKTLKGFTADRKKMSEQQAKALTDFIAGLTKNVGNMIKGFQKDHKAMANELNESLKKSESDRLKDFKHMMGNIRKGIKDIETYVKNKAEEFNDAHAGMSAALKKDLAKYVSGIVSETSKLLRGFEDEREKMAAHWDSLTATMAKKRAGKPLVVVSGEEEVMTVEEAVAKRGRKRGRKKGAKRSRST